MPPEYCAFGQKDSSACKEWLLETHPLLYREIYGEDAADEGKVKTKAAEGEEQKAGEEGLPEEGKDGEPVQKA